MNELQTAGQKTLQATENYTALAVQYLSSMGLNLQERHKTQFIQICQAYGLNPFKREIYGVPYGNNFNIIVGYEVYLKRAERSGKLNGWGVVYSNSGQDLTATITIYRKDWEKPFVHSVEFSEYNANTQIWKSKPKTMLRKVAIAQGFRMCFPDELSGIPYTSDELGQDENELKQTQAQTFAQAQKTAENAPVLENREEYQASDFDTF